MFKDFFLLRNAMRNRGIISRPSVYICLSVTLVYCIKTAEDIIKLVATSFYTF